MSIIKVDTIKDETGANTLVTQSGSDFVWGAGVPAGTVLQVVATTDNTEYGTNIGTTHTNYSELNTAITLKSK